MLKITSKNIVHGQSYYDYHDAPDYDPDVHSGEPPRMVYEDGPVYYDIVVAWSDGTKEPLESHIKSPQIAQKFFEEHQNEILLDSVNPATPPYITQVLLYAKGNADGHDWTKIDDILWKNPNHPAPTIQ